MKKALAAVALTAGVLGSAAACTHVHTYANSTYCVNEMTGEVMPPQYCQVGSAYYNPGLYDYWVGATHGHSYNTGVIIQHNYFTSGRQVSPTDSSARRSAGIPASGTVSNGRTATTRSSASSTPARPQNAPASGSTSRPSTSSRPSSGSTSHSGSSHTGGASGGRSSSSGSRSSSSHH